jgi:hypothetical protein
MTQANETLQQGVVYKEELLEHWQGHRRLTRKVIAAFPEKEFFSFSIGGMRPFSQLVSELLGIAAPGLGEIVTGETASYKIDIDNNSKDAFLKLWD